MSVFKIKCEDGSDHNCLGVAEVYDIGIDEKILTNDQMAYIEKCLDEFNESEDDDDPLEITLEISKEQAQKIGINISDKDLKDGMYEYNLEINRAVCDACGSDQTYDDEGNNISAL